MHCRRQEEEKDFSELDSKFRSPRFDFSKNFSKKVIIQNVKFLPFLSVTFVCFFLSGRKASLRKGDGTQRISMERVKNF